MKYNIQITLLLIGVFLISQLIGLGFIYQDLEVVQSPSGQITVIHPDTAIGERPDIDKNSGESVGFVLTGVLIGTILLLVIIRFGKVNIWRILFFIAIISTITIALGVFLSPLIAIVLALVLTIAKLYRHNLVVHNGTEFLIYAGIAILFVPLFNIFWAIVLLLIISGYDAFAVWQSKHMIKMAKFQTGSNLFAGLMIRTGGKVKAGGKKVKTVRSSSKSKRDRVQEAIIGGGDIAFPLIFAGVVMESLLLTATKEVALLKTLIIPIVLTIVLFLLLTKGKEGRFYPAMPFLTAGCLIGLGIIYLLPF